MVLQVVYVLAVVQARSPVPFPAVVAAADPEQSELLELLVVEPILVVLWLPALLWPEKMEKESVMYLEKMLNCK